MTLFACNSKGETWASVNDVDLLEEDAKVLMHYFNYNPDLEEDRKKFTSEWVEKQIFLQELLETNPQEAEMIKLKSFWHQGDLARFYLEESFIQEQLETEISDSTILDYYNAHLDDFSLNDYIVRALYIKVPKQAPDQEKLKEHYLLKKDKDLSKVISYAKQHAENFHFDDSTWVYFEELTKDAPTQKLNKDNLVLNRTKTYFADDQFVYYLNIIDFKLKDAAPPVEFLTPMIRQLLISQKLNQFKDKNSASFFNKIKQKHEIYSRY